MRGEDKLPVLSPATAPPQDAPSESRIKAPYRARRILSVHMQHFAMERWQRTLTRQGDAPPEDVPQALATEGPHGRIIYATNRAAEAAGVHINARAVDMRALCPDLKLAYADIGGDTRALEALALWARRWCPWTATDGLSSSGAGLIMDTTGSAHLWGGEAALLREIEERLSHLGLSSTLAIAPTHGAAWALARFGGVRETCSADALEQRMSNMPTRALRLTADTLLLLKRLGLKSVGDLAAVPRLSLARRFQKAELPANPLLRLDQMMGDLAEPISPPEDPPRFIVDARLPEPVQDPTPHIPDLCAALSEKLAGPGFGARRLRLTVYRSDGQISHVEAATSTPSRNASHLARLFEGKLERIDPGFGFDLITLAAHHAEHLTVSQPDLDRRKGTGDALGQLIDRLSARFGPGHLRSPALRESHIPERREIWAPAMGGLPRQPFGSADARPIRLLDPPEEVRVIYAVPEGPPAQFVWRRITHKVARFSGPERIAPEWWADNPGTRLRDYYNIENQFFHRIWLYREGILDDHRGPDPRWCVHGVFA